MIFKAGITKIPEMIILVFLRNTFLINKKRKLKSKNLLLEIIEWKPYPTLSFDKKLLKMNSLLKGKRLALEQFLYSCESVWLLC